MVRSTRPDTSAVTWGILQRSLAGTDWPAILQTDSTGQRTADTRIRLLNLLYVATTVLLAIAAVTTPAGLFDEFRYATASTMTDFGTARDSSVFGQVSKQTNDAPWRICSDYWQGNDSIMMDVQCPGDSQTYTVIQNASGLYQDWDGPTHYVTVDPSRVEIYHSGLAGISKTVSSFFDIQARRVIYSTGDYDGEFGNVLPVDGFRHFLTTVVDDDYLLIDGLIVDAKRGGIGFRNHTIPMNAPLGAEWVEDLLFIEPEAACTDMNISYQFEVPYLSSNSTSSTVGNIYYLVDHGGLTNLDISAKPKFPAVRQDTLDVQQRADIQAYWGLYNILNTSFMNLSDPATNLPNPEKSFIGNRIKAIDDYSDISATTGIQTGTVMYDLIDDMNPTSTEYDSRTPFYDRWEECGHWNKTLPVDIDNFPISCGYFIGAAVQTNGQLQSMASEGMQVERKVYSCAAATKATIKTVQFRYNLTADQNADDLSNIRILSVVDKQYSSPEKEPLWAVETPKPLLTGNMNQLWGLVSSEYVNTPNITTLRSSHLYLTFWPGFGSIESDYKASSYLPAALGLGAIMSTVWDTNPALSTVGESFFWNGYLDLKLLRRWQILGQNAKTASLVPALVWTDIASNYFTGSRGWLSNNIIPRPYNNDTQPGLSKRDTPADEPVTTKVPTFQAERKILYHWPYGVPAFLMCFILLLLLPITFFAAITGGIKDVRRYLSMLSAGRLLLHISPDESKRSASEVVNYYRMPYRRWARTKELGMSKVRAEGWQWIRQRKFDPGWTGTPEMNGFGSLHGKPESEMVAVEQDHEQNLGGKPVAQSRDTLLGNVATC
ncbi:uncharacterized protein Z518_00098 [Rhinocladiella mackenziei CBS 650.93]|uniref:Uncharacterized protein n=1 Tax=Rhinocladiella mackenziei CBS 650.93 TaxID=1442369 RepID=A0A0D2JI54_9EURO|nr:uncharacterized protein Z518_00098 [Rhinocladiella mackenziei CBS 650.93]KIX09020.1 hypothetical protein Z518_00098 [Rhinocladiella mackenziei CBS 650.93]